MKSIYKLCKKNWKCPRDCCVTLHLFASADTKAKKQKLECLATFALFGNVMSMQSVRLAGSQRDALLLSFKDAKVRESAPATSCCDLGCIGTVVI